MRGGLDLRVGRACSDGCPSQCLQRLTSVGGEGGCNGSPTSFMPHNNDLLLWCPGLFLLTFLVVELIIPVLSGCLSTVNSCPFPWSTSKLHFPAPSLPQQQGMHDSGWVVQGCGTDQACSSVFALLSTDHPLHSPSILQKAFSVPAHFPIVAGGSVSERGNFSSSSASHHGCWPHF